MWIIKKAINREFLKVINGSCTTSPQVFPYEWIKMWRTFVLDSHIPSEYN
jgi:hypothetical protein